MTGEQENKPVFSKQSVLDKQNAAKEAYEKKVIEVRQDFEAVAATDEGMKVLRYLFLICGGDISRVRRDKDRVIDVEDTLVALGTGAVWETIRYNFKSDTLQKIERHNWEE